MADITMCKGGDCTLKETCYRYRAKQNDFYQSYFETPPFKKQGSCDEYWQMVWVQGGRL